MSHSRRPQPEAEEDDKETRPKLGLRRQTDQADTEHDGEEDQGDAFCSAPVGQHRPAEERTAPVDDLLQVLQVAGDAGFGSDGMREHPDAGSQRRRPGRPPSASAPRANPPAEVDRAEKDDHRQGQLVRQHREQVERDGDHVETTVAPFEPDHGEPETASKNEIASEISAPGHPETGAVEPRENEHEPGDHQGVDPGHPELAQDAVEQADRGPGEEYRPGQQKVLVHPEHHVGKRDIEDQDRAEEGEFLVPGERVTDTAATRWIKGAGPIGPVVEVEAAVEDEGREGQGAKDCQCRPGEP